MCVHNEQKSAPFPSIQRERQFPFKNTPPGEVNGYLARGFVHSFGHSLTGAGKRVMLPS